MDLFERLVCAQVGAVSLKATLNCDGFASAHSSTSHFDRSSFVGLAWRPPNEEICCGALLLLPVGVRGGP